MITAEQEAAILRYMSNGTLLAQCNVVQLPSRPATKPLSMREYKTEIAKIATADPNAKLVSANEFKTKENASAFRVEVTGLEENVPVTWLYYHVANNDGRRVTFVFTLQGEVQDIFQPADRAMVDSLKFFPKAAQPKRSAKTGGSKNSTRR